MILDKQLIFSESQAVTAAAGSTNIVNQGAAGNAYGNELFLVVQTKTAAAASGAATVNFQLRTSANADMSSSTVLFDSGAIGKAALTVGSEPVKAKVPLGAKQYIDVYYNVGTGPLTAGAFTAFLTPDVKS